MWRMQRLWSAIGFAFFGTWTAALCASQENASPPSFHRDVRPILQAHCQGCHQPAKAAAKLDLTSHRSIMRGIAGEAVVIPHDSAASLLIESVIPFETEPPSMPKDRPPLTDYEIAILRDWIAAGASDDTPESLRSPVNAANPPVYSRPPVITCLDYSPDGQMLAISGYHEVLLYKADGSELLARLVGLSERIQSLRFSPHGKRLAVAGGSPARFGELQIWDVNKLRLAHSVLSTYDTLYGVSWSPSGDTIAYGCADNSVRAVEARTGKEILYQGAHDDWVLGTAFSTDGSHLVSISRDRSLKLIKVATQQFIDNITSITPGALKGGLMAIERHPTRDELLVAGSDGTPRLYRMYREKDRVIGDDFNLIRAFQSLPGRIFCLDITNDGQYWVAGSSSKGRGTVILSKLEDAAVVWTLELPTPIYTVRFHPEAQQLAAAGTDGRIRVISFAQGTVEHEFIPVPLADSPILTEQ